MTSVEKINTVGTSIDTTEEFFPTALEVGGIRLKGYDPNNATNYSTKFFNRVVTNIADAATAEAGSVNEPWEGGGGAGALTGALASAAAIKAYVDDEIVALVASAVQTSLLARLHLALRKAPTLLQRRTSTRLHKLIESSYRTLVHKVQLKRPCLRTWDLHCMRILLNLLAA